MGSPSTTASLVGRGPECTTLDRMLGEIREGAERNHGAADSPYRPIHHGPFG